MPRIEVEIGEVVLHGGGDAAGLGAAIEAHLGGLAAGRRVAGDTAAGQVANAIWERLPASARPDGAAR